jgi:DNA-binding Lrp family transcriptional regulator
MPIALKYKNAERYDRIPIQQTRESKLNTKKYYCTGQDLTISMVEIVASSMEEAEAVMQRFIDEIGKVMKDEVRWDEANWTIQENTMNEAGTEWVVTDEGVPDYYEMSDVEADADTLASAGYGTDEDYA